jgi:hypothetical protein
MAINEAVNIDIDVNGVNTVKDAANAYEDLGDAVSQTQLEAEKLAQQFGINDKRTQEAIKVAGRYKQEMENLDFAIDAARGGSDQLFRAAQGVTAGFELAAGATAIFGGESEELEKVLLKVQGAMAFSQGLKDLQEFGPAILNIAKATRTWLRSLDLLQKSFLGLGIAAIVGLVYSLRDAFTSVSEETKKAAKEQKEYNDQLRDLQNERIALTQGELRASQVRLYQREQELKANNEAIKQAEARIKQDQQVLKLTGDQAVGAEEHRKKLKDLRLENFRLTNQVIKLRNETNRLFYAQLDQQDQTDNVTKSVKENTKAIENNLLTSEKLKGQSIENVTDIGEATMRTTDATLSFVETEQKSFFERSKLFVGAYGEDISKTLKDVLAVSTEFTLNMSDKATQDYEKRIEKLKELGYTEEQISNMRDKELLKIDERGRKAFEIQKRLRYAQTLISSIEGTQNAYTTAQESPITAVVPVYPLIQAGLAAAFGIAQLQQISQSSYESQDRPSISSASAGGGFNGRFNAPSVRLPRTEQFTGQQRIYVTEYDISNTQERVKVTEDVSIVK